MIRTRHAAAAALAAGTALLLPLFPGRAVPAAAAVPQAGQALVRPVPPADRVSAYLDRIRDRPQELRAFFEALPKGGDLHNHLSGAASTELLIQLAAEDGLCIDTATSTAVVGGPCPAGSRPAADAVTDPAFRQQVIRAWSMQDFVPGAESGHDHFFATFGKFGEASWRHPGRMLAEVTDTLARQNQSYLETMSTPASGGAAALAAKVGFDSDLAALRARLLADDQIGALVRTASGEADAALTEFRATSHCDGDDPAPGCAVTVRFISQASRASTPARVFTQLLLGMELARHDPRYVAVNLVQPEDAPASLENYRLQMQMLDYLHGEYPEVHITLHAGELVPGLVKPEDLRFHIREAVLTGHADRIGHGVDLAHEDDPEGLLRTMAARHVLVEVPLTSNEQILGVSGPEHPFPRYLAAGVPVALATDDPGVSRGDITTEYQRAALTYGLDYRVLRDLARASLEYAFLPGRSLWADRDGYRPAAECAHDPLGEDEPSAACAALLDDNPKAELEWREECAFRTFEQAVLGRQS
ncbi:adenosine deaminase [Kitasatospora sp. MBT63]|uniref:adenosine deaminase family protein n=1 Tax=Kitasatospora sp. MBT63 TaxID=1444768 RepID=UPI00053B1731|nr:adenosine deaminase [Kitasatospora sp. MBT63]